MTSFDVIVIGAGHNGMAAATTLAKSGRRVLVVEAARHAGGMVQANELAPGFNIPILAHLINQLSDDVIRTLDLERHGLVRGKAVPTLTLSNQQAPLIFGGAYGSHVTGLSPQEIETWKAFRERLILHASLFARFLDVTPARPGTGGAALKLTAAKAAWALRRAGKEELRQFLRMALMCIADVASEAISDDRLQGLLSFDATLGVKLGPRSPTSLLGLYYRLAGSDGTAWLPSGDMGSVAKAFQQAAEAAGVTFRFGAQVARIMVEGERACGIATYSGEEVRARQIMSAISPAATFLKLVAPGNLDTGFLRDIRNIRNKGNTSKLNLALDRRPRFDGLDTTHETARLIYANSVDHVENSFNPSKYGELPADPCFEAVLSDRFACSGAAGLSIIIQNTPYDLKDGWDIGRQQVQQAVLHRLETLSPGIGKSVIASDFLSPRDIERRFNVPGGHWHHGELQADRMFSLRPVFAASDYRAPIAGLYICGAGTHPGGGISARSGLNAARAIMHDQPGGAS